MNNSNLISKQMMSLFKLELVIKHENKNKIIC